MDAMQPCKSTQPRAAGLRRQVTAPFKRVVLIHSQRL